MSYLVLARKWRPKQFDDVVGQRAITQTLKNAIQSGRIAHAYLFSGQRGVGKTTTARILAKAINCKEGPTPDPCDICTLCQEINKGSSIDVIEIDGASNNSVDDIRDLREKVHYIPAKGRYKVYIIDEVHMLSKPAFNALLKTLEEPPEHVIFILATTEAHKIPITILSRCQRYDFRRISSQDISAYLEKLVEAEGGLKGDREDALRLIAKTADGSLRDALSLIDQVISLNSERISLQQVLDLVSLVDYHTIGEMMRAVVEGKPKKALLGIEKVTDRGHDLKHFVEQMMHFIRDAVLFKLNEEEGTGMEASSDEAKELAALDQITSQADLLRYFEILTKTVEKMKFSSQPRLILEMAIIRMTELCHLESLENLIQRLALLEHIQSETTQALPNSAQEPLTSIFETPNPEKENLHAQEGPLPADKTDDPVQSDPAPQSDQNDLNWMEVVRQVKEESMMFGSVLEHLKIERQEGSNVLELALREDNPFYLKLIEAKDNQSLLRAALEKVSGNNIQIKWLFQKEKGKSTKDQMKEETKKKQSSPMESSLNLINREPIIQKAMEIFSAQIIETHIVDGGKNDQTTGNGPS